MKEEKKKIRFSSATPISTFLFESLKQLYWDAIKKEIINTNSRRHRINYFSIQGLNAFTIAVATWESLLNEQFTSDLIQDIYKGNLLFDIIDKAESWDLKTKTLAFPKFLFNKTFDKSINLYQNLDAIIGVRNNIVHYKYSFYTGPEKELIHLRNMKISYPNPPNTGSSWVIELFSTECIRFCINTISSLVEELSKLESPEYKQFNPVNKDFFHPITDTVVSKYFVENNIDPNVIDDSSFDIKS